MGTSKLRDLYERFEEELAKRQARAKAARPKWEPPKTKLDEDPGEPSSRGPLASGLGGLSSQELQPSHDVAEGDGQRSAAPRRARTWSGGDRRFGLTSGLFW